MNLSFPLLEGNQKEMLAEVFFSWVKWEIIKVFSTLIKCLICWIYEGLWKLILYVLFYFFHQPGFMETHDMFFIQGIQLVGSVASDWTSNKTSSLAFYHENFAHTKWCNDLFSSQKQAQLVLLWYSEVRHVCKCDGVVSERASVSDHTGRGSCWVLSFNSDPYSGIILTFYCPQICVETCPSTFWAVSPLDYINKSPKDVFNQSLCVPSLDLTRTTLVS